MTIAGYVAAPFIDVYQPDTFLYPLGSGTLGYAWPAAIGAKLARPDATCSRCTATAACSTASPSC